MPKISAISSTEWDKTNEICLTIQDYESGVSSYQLTKEIEELTSWNDLSTTQEIYNQIIENIDSNGLYNLWAKDKAGNISNQFIEIKYVDKEGPDITLIYDTKWSNSIMFPIQVQDNQSGISAYSFSNQANQEDWQFLNQPSSNKEFSFQINENGTYYFEAKDRVGNISSKGINISNIDKNPPIIDLTATTTWIKKSQTITAKVKDNESGIKKYAWSTENIKPDNWITME